MLCISILDSSVFALGVSRKELSDNAIDDEVYDYLINAGYPIPIIESLNEVAIAEIYNGRYEYQTSDVVYGIFTEEHKITYEISADGKIIIDNENLLALNDLLNDKGAVEKVRLDRKTVFERREEAKLGQDYYINDSLVAKAVSDRDATILSLSNWYATLTINKISQSNTYLEKSIIYAWNWYYSPVWKLTDKAAVAWSKGFTLDPNSATWAYKAWGDFGANVSGGPRQVTHTWSGKGCTEYNPDCGFGQEIDIRFDFEHNGWTYRTYQHGGSISGKLSKYLTGSDRGVQNVASAVGRYYHKQVGIAGSLSFSSGGPSISIGNALSYDASPDTGAQFNYYQ